MRKGQKMTPAAKANWLAAVRKTNNKPGSKMPASGMPANGTPARDPEPHQPHKPFTAEHQPPASALVVGHMTAQMLAEAAQARAETVITKLDANLELPAGHPMQMAAARELLDRGYGKALERVVSIPAPVPVPIDLNQLTETQLDALEEVLLMTERPAQKQIEGTVEETE